MGDLTTYLNNSGFYHFEGYSQQVDQQVKDLIAITNKPNLRVMEIGFNAGHSADVFLKNNKFLDLTSFDLGEHAYVLAAKRYIDETYPNRHTLIIGDSTKSVPKFISSLNNHKFDIIFIDGGHAYETAKTDLENCMYLAHKDTIVILDDTIFTPGWEACWTTGPTRAWTEMVNNGKIVDIDKKDYQPGRGMAWGKYVI